MKLYVARCWRSGVIESHSRYMGTFGFHSYCWCWFPSSKFTLKFHGLRTYPPNWVKLFTVFINEYTELFFINQLIEAVILRQPMMRRSLIFNYNWVPFHAIFCVWQLIIWIMFNSCLSCMVNSFWCSWSVCMKWTCWDLPV